MGLPIPNAAAGPPDDIHALIASFRPDALRVARRLVRTEAEAEDLAQTAVMNVLARAHAISDPAFVKPYLMTTVRNLWRNQLRAGSRYEILRDQTIFDRIADPTPEDSVISSLDADTLRIAMETLSGANVELIRLRYVEHLDYSAIGERLGVTTPTARQRVHRAREHLRSACFTIDPEVTTKRVCHLTRIRLGRFVRSSMPRRVAARVTLHLRGCEECRVCYSRLTDVFGVTPDPEIFPDPEPET